MANILADAYNKAINEEGEKMDKQQSEAAEVPSPNNTETDKTVDVKALDEATADMEEKAPVKQGPEVNPATTPRDVETDATVKLKALGEAEAEPEVLEQGVDPTTSPNDVETDKAKDLIPAPAEVEEPSPVGPGPGPMAEAKASGRREKGCCEVAQCKHSEMELLHKCVTCKKYIHIVCSIDNKLQGEDDSFYCSLSCAGRDEIIGTTGQDSLLETNPGTELKADDGDPTTPENNPSPSDDSERAQSLSEDLKQNIEDPADSINENPPSSSSSPSPASEPEENQRVLRSTPSPGSKNKKKAQASKATPSPGLKKKKGRKTRSTTIASSTKKKPPVAGAQESSIPLVPDYDVLVGMTSAEKIEFFRDMRRRFKYTRPYIAHAYDLVHDFRKCDIRVVHIIRPKKSAKPKKDEKDSDDNEKKAGALKPSPKAKESESPPAVVQQKRSGKPQKDKGDAVDKDKKAGVSDSSSKPTEGDSPDPASGRIRIKETRGMNLRYRIRPQN